MRLKNFAKRHLLPLAARPCLQGFYRGLHRLALVGMNIGPVGEVSTSGEARLAPKLLRLAPPNAIVVDVGANRGEFSILCAPHLPPGGRIFAFEPSPSIYRRFVQNIIATGHASRITALQQGLADRPSRSRIFVPSGFEGEASMHARRPTRSEGTISEETIDLTTLDEFCRQIGIESIFLLKIDIEGGEFACLQGSSALLSARRIDFLQFEFGGCDIESRVFLRDFWDLLSPHYDLFRILQNGLLPLPRYHELLEIFTTTNFLAVRRGLPIP